MTSGNRDEVNSAAQVLAQGLAGRRRLARAAGWAASAAGSTSANIGSGLDPSLYGDARPNGGWQGADMMTAPAQQTIVNNKLDHQRD
jgi:hypothetical protein